jgi:integrase/recombinase XerD
LQIVCKFSMISTALFLDTRRPYNKTGKYPLKLRVTFNRLTHFYNVVIDNKKLVLSKAVFVNINSLKTIKDNKELKTKINLVLDEANNIIENIDHFNFEKFEKIYLQNKHNSLPDFFNSKIDRLNSENRIGTAVSYNCCLNSLQAFKSDLNFTDITPEFLSNYERDMVLKENSLTTVGIYLRSLRAIINEATEAGMLRNFDYPFGKSKYQIPKGNNVKKALQKKEINKIVNYQPKNKFEEKAKDFWLFSYYANGMNITDILKLKFKNLDGDKFVFFRSKTINILKGDPKPITVFITPPLKKIIAKWKNNSKKPNDYIFPFLQADIDAVEEKRIIQNFTRFINQHLKNITNNLKMSNISTYTARHSYATAILNLGGNVKLISDNLGHNSLQTTEQYLNGFDDKIKRRMANKLIKL